jgi:hypothetical protein
MDLDGLSEVFWRCVYYVLLAVSHSILFMNTGARAQPAGHDAMEWKISSTRCWTNKSSTARLNASPVKFGLLRVQSLMVQLNGHPRGHVTTKRSSGSSFYAP